MKITGIQFFKKLGMWLAMLLCSLLTAMQPVPLQAAPARQTVAAGTVSPSDQDPLTLFAGETNVAEALGVLQLDKDLLIPILHAFLDKSYPQFKTSGAVHGAFPASKGDSGLHTILTTGP